jgi:hypothetical protein
MIPSIQYTTTPIAAAMADAKLALLRQVLADREKAK